MKEASALTSLFLCIAAAVTILKLAGVGIFAQIGWWWIIGIMWVPLGFVLIGVAWGLVAYRMSLRKAGKGKA